MNRTNSFGPDPLLVAFWAAICGAPAVLGAWLLFKAPTNESLTQFVWLLAFPLLPVVFASRFRVLFAPNEFVYRRWGPTIRVVYEDIDRIEVANVTPVSGQAIGAFVVTKQGKKLPFWPKLFPREAVERFFALAPR